VCGAVYLPKRCTCMSGLRSMKQPIYLLRAMSLNALVPIQFEPKMNGHCLS
jgi:hypothetical protein